MLEIRLKPGREKSVLRRHPWIFASAISAETDSDVQDMPGTTVKVVDSKGDFLGWGALSPRSNIRLRLWSWDESDRITADFFKRRLTSAIDHRKSLHHSGQLNAYRLVHGESDGLPGLIVDQYDSTLVVQFLTCGADYWRESIVNQLVEITDCQQIYERSDVEIRQLEGLERRKGCLIGDCAQNPVEIEENGIRYKVDFVDGQKTGFFLDQRDNRSIVQELSGGKSVLDCFAYTGGFTISALKGGAKDSTVVEESSTALQMLKENLVLNRIAPEKVEYLQADVFKMLRKFRDSSRTFDLIVLDPPKFAPTAAHAQKAARGYKDINLLALKLLNPGGQLVTFSCSGGVSAELFQQIIAGAALDAGVEGKIIGRMGPGIDHPVALNFPEGAYLKGLIVQV
jgi:23S rRNA (cytosine1962-C5)-methyltransferase